MPGDRPFDGGMRPGDRIGDVVVEREIGAGAFGVVWLGRDTLIGRPVALKVLRGAENEVRAEDRERAIAEARLVGGLRSPHIVTLHHIHRISGDRWVLELEYVDGGSLADLLGKDLRLPVATACRIARGVLLGLARAHEEGILHGDVKPENVLLGADGTAKLADFGLARALGERSSTDEPDWTPRGTPEFMAPEVLLGSPPATASDLWSVGVVLHRMLAGRLPFTGPDVVSVFHAIQNAEPPPLPPDVPAALSSLVTRCLEKRPEERRVDASAAIEVIDHVLAGVPARALPPAPSRPSGFGGRDAELASLERALQDVQGGTSAVVVLSGPEGIGKSTLLRHARPIAHRMGFSWVEAAVSPVEGMIRPLLRAVRGSLVESEAASISAHIDPARFGSAAPALRSLFADGTRVDLESRQQVVWVVLRLLQGLASSGPLVLVIEDAHRADAQETALLRDLAARLASSRVLLVLVSRTATAVSTREAMGSAAFVEIEGARRVTLGTLPPHAILALIEGEAGGARVDPEAVERIVRAAGGNPLFAVEMLRHSLESEALVRRGGDLVRGPGWAEASVPSRLADVVWRRVDRLPGSARMLLEAAAVDGLEFDGQAVAAILRKPLLAVLRQLQRLARDEGLVVPTPKGFRFAHALLHDLLYGEVAPELRHALHGAFAEHLEGRAADVDAERLAIHWERAGDAGRARPYLLRAADAAIARSEFVRAIDLARRAGLAPGAISAEDARANRAFLGELVRAYAITSAPRADVESLYDTIIAAADADRDAGAKMRAVVRRAYYRFLRGGLGEGEESQVRAASDLLPLGVDLGRARYLLGVAAVVRGETEEGRRWLRSADEVFAKVPGGERHHASVLDRLASLANAEGHGDEAERLYEESAALSERVGMTVNAEASRVNRLLVAFARGDLEVVEEGLRRAIRVLGLLRSRELAAHSTVLLGQVRFALGGVPEAAALVDDALRQLGASEYLPVLFAAHELAAQVALVRGDVEAASQSVQRAQEVVQRRHDAAGLISCDVLAAWVACARGSPRDAVAALDRLFRRPLGAALPQRRDAALAVAEMAVWGLPPATLGAAESFLEGARGAPESALAATRTALRGARAWAEGTKDASAVRAGGEALRGPGIGMRRALRVALGSFLVGEGLRLAGDDRGAAAEAERAFAQCRELGYAALEARLRACSSAAASA
jgi:hypothetical protein